MRKIIAKFKVRASGSVYSKNEKETGETWDIDITNWPVEKVDKWSSEITEIMYE